MDNLDMNRIPEHIAIIMDGNGRWATERGKERSYGHQAGVDAVRRITSECTRLGVKYLTLDTFSTENWNRPADEIAALMGLVLTSLEDEIFMKNNVRFRVIGDLKRLPQAVQDKLAGDHGPYCQERCHDHGGGPELLFTLGNHECYEENRKGSHGVLVPTYEQK